TRRLSRKRTPELQTTSEPKNAPPAAAGPRGFIERRTHLSELLDKIGLTWDSETEAAMASSQWMRLAVEGPQKADKDLATQRRIDSVEADFHELSDSKKRSRAERDASP
ncbi:MAG: hypothetical protein VX189_00635, partial [Planctomycetota bacterium]|nr:hypothetical protein [Planctomycetota bacterium]